MKELIKITKTDLGKSNMTSGNKFRIRLSRKDRSGTISFTYHDNFRNKCDKNDIIYSLLLDASGYKQARDEFDFCREFGYTDISEGTRIYKACKRQAEKLDRLFTVDEQLKLEEEFQEY